MNYLDKSYEGKKVLITGRTGFKGSWLSLWLKNVGADVLGISDEVPTEPSNFEASNLSNLITDKRFKLPNTKEVKKVINKFEPDFIFHLAAQALVKDSFKSPLITMTSNALGSASILEALIDYKKSVSVVMITSDKVYNNLEWQWGYKETDELGGKDPYSASKGMAELAIKSMVNSFFSMKDSGVRIGIARAGNVIGGGDWAKDRIVPDTIRSASKEKSVGIRSLSSTRPWQHVLEPISGYLLLGSELSNHAIDNGEAYNFGPNSDNNFSVKDLLCEMSKNWDKISWHEVESDDFKEARLLKLNIDKAMMDLQWKPTLSFAATVKLTVDWYKEYYSQKSKDMSCFSMNQINEFIRATRNIY